MRSVQSKSDYRVELVRNAVEVEGTPAWRSQIYGRPATAVK